MDRRAEDVEASIDSLTEALAAPRDNATILKLCERAQLAREMRSADEILGLTSVDPARLAALDETIGRALVFVGEHGDPRGFSRLADLFVRRGAPRRAVLAYQRAAHDGDVDAWERLAALVWDLRDETNASLARQAIAHAPDGVLGGARYLEGLFAFHGFGGPRDLEASVALHRRAAALGNTDAMFELYAMRSQGLGGPVDLVEAIDFCRRAADGGNVRAMYNMGAFHATGQQVERDPERALAWYVRAADAGHGRAAATAAVMILSGVGATSEATVDRSRAVALIDLANKNGFDARQLLERSGYAAAVASTLSNNETQTHQGAAQAAEGTKDSSMNTNATVEKVKKVAQKAVKAAKKTTSDAAKALVEAVTPAKKTAKKSAKKKAAKKPAAKKAAKPAAKKAAKKPAAKKAAKKPAAKKPAAKKAAKKKAAKK